LHTKPTTEQVLRGVAEELRSTVLPDVGSEPVKVMVGMMVQLIEECAVRAAHEIAWAHEEAVAIGDAAGQDLGAPPSLHLDAVAGWYGIVSRTLSDGIERAYRSGDPAQIDKWRALIEARQANEQTILGTLDLVGRG
jgi:hypothetical protein